ncbi:MAG: hypothetical protein HC937_03800 [Aquincola sp.]|nr:hypothetical protein [Aquincola sp.]
MPPDRVEGSGIKLAQHAPVPIEQHRILSTALDLSVPVSALVERLLAFRPTLVAVEQPLRDSLRLSAEFDAWSRGAALIGNEYQQVGFRLATAAGLRGVRAVDMPSTLVDNPLPAFLQRHPRHGATMARWMRSVGAPSTALAIGYAAARSGAHCRA